MRKEKNMTAKKPYQCNEGEKKKKKRWSKFEPRRLLFHHHQLRLSLSKLYHFCDDPYNSRPGSESIILKVRHDTSLAIIYEYGNKLGHYALGSTVSDLKYINKLNLHTHLHHNHNSTISPLNSTSGLLPTYLLTFNSISAPQTQEEK
ncbi:hypothetical protein VNO77_10821 [Canavalia gladiata]|uniref:Uncharacterized protein n=1 Tax=Canavalia gladiata TaxID=3824 RepID=A0AAN9MHE3_CANGL